MKLRTFTASNNQKVIAMIHEALGFDALVYSTRSVPNGVEIVAGLPDDLDEQYEKEYSLPQNQQANNTNVSSQNGNIPANILPDMSLIEKLNSELQIINDSMQNLSRHVDKRLHERLDMSDDEHTAKRNILFYHLNKLGFKNKFCKEFISNYYKLRNIEDPVRLSDIEADLHNYVHTTKNEIVDGKNICALIGPTGIGKTTTILKLARRYITNYGPEKLGMITTDYHDISGKNLLLHYQNLYNIDLEYAGNPAELAMVIKSMKNKDLILIDTHGASQRDAQNVAQLVELMESQGNKLSTYIVLPGNVQEPILDEIARTFKTANLDGCILTKLDECISIAPVLGVAMNHKLNIAYTCNGQDLNKDIERASAEKIIYQLMNENADHKLVIENNIFGNLSRSSANSNEGRYER